MYLQARPLKTLSASKARGEVDLHNREPEFEANKQQRGANLNKVTQLEHKNSRNGKLYSLN